MELVARQGAGLAQHHHPTVGEQRRCPAGVHDGGHVELLAGEVLHHEGTLAVADKLAHQFADRVP